MTLQKWRVTPVSRRVYLLRWLLPAAIVVVVVIYQLVFAAYAHDNFGHTEHTAMELLFYAGLGPVVAWATLTQIGRWLNEKEEAEQAVRAGERQLAGIVDASADAILSIDAQGIIRSWNRGAARLFGYAGEEQIGRPLAEFLPDMPGNHRSDSAQPGLHSRHYEAVVQMKDGHRLPVDGLVVGVGLPSSSERR